MSFVPDDATENGLDRAPAVGAPVSGRRRDVPGRPAGSLEALLKMAPGTLSAVPGAGKVAPAAGEAARDDVSPDDSEQKPPITGVDAPEEPATGPARDPDPDARTLPGDGLPRGDGPPALPPSAFDSLAASGPVPGHDAGSAMPASRDAAAGAGQAPPGPPGGAGQQVVRGGFAPFAGLGAVLGTVTKAPVRAAGFSARVAAQAGRHLKQAHERRGVETDYIQRTNAAIDGMRASLQRNDDFMKRAMNGLPGSAFSEVYRTSPSFKAACDENRRSAMMLEKTLAGMAEVGEANPRVRRHLRSYTVPGVKKIMDSMADNPDRELVGRMQKMYDAFLQAVEAMLARLTGSRRPSP